MDYAVVTVQTVSRILIAATMGAFVKPMRSCHSRNLGLIATHVFLPAITFASLATSLTWSDVRVMLLTVVFSFVGMLAGYLSAVCFNCYLPTEWHPLCKWTSTYPTAMALPLPIAASLFDLPWYGEREYNQALGILFVHNFGISVVMWSSGHGVMANYLARQERDQQLQKEAAEGKNVDRPVSGGLRNTVGSSKPLLLRLYSAFIVYFPPVVLACFLGASVGLNGPLKHVFSIRGVLGPLTGACKMLGEGFVPIMMVLLGVSLANGIRDPTAEEKESSRIGLDAARGFGEVQCATAPRSRGTPCRGISSKLGVPVPLIASVLVGRFISSPVAVWLCLNLAIFTNALPSDRVVVLTLMVAAACPSGIAITALCSYYSYKEREVGKLLLIVYVASILFVSVWLFMNLLYAETFDVL